MSYRHAFLVIPIDADPRPAVAALRRAAPRCETLVVLGLGTSPPGRQDALRAALAAAAPAVDVRSEPDPSGLALAAAAAGSDLIVVATRARAVTSSVLEARRWLSVPILWVADTAPAAVAPHTLCVARGARALAALGSFLRDHGAAGERVTVAAWSSPIPLDDLPALLEVAGVEARVEILPASLRELPRAFDWARDHAVDLLVVAQLPPALLLGVIARRGLPLLVLPLPPTGAASARQPVDASDLVDAGGSLRARVELPSAVGAPAPLADVELAFVSGGRIVATAVAREGEVALPRALDVAALGLYRAGGGSDDPLAAIEQHVAVLRPGRRLLLLDAALAEAELATVRDATAGEGAPEPVAVRLRPVQRFELVRTRLRAAGLSPPRVIDATEVLAEGEPLDVPEEADAVRLARVAARLRGSGFDVAAIVHRGRHPPATVGFAALLATELTAVALASPAAGPADGGSLAARLAATTGTAPIAGGRVEVELDNARAREWLLGAIARSRRRVHLQTYMLADDELAYLVERALAAAGARGVTVRVLVDSLHGLHGSLGATNPVLARLSACPGIEVRVSRPVTGVPSIEDLKQRDHRKLVVVDGNVALLGGRNVGHEYYTALAEEAVTAQTIWRRVPWLDAGARVEGPAVAALERALRDAWIDAGGAPFEVAEPAPAGDVIARVVVHRGLRDAFSLETYLALIDTARSHVYFISGFPLQLEIQHALLRALRRGVRVRGLVGAVSPTYGDNRPFAGPLATSRHLATQFVHSRLDALVAAGAEAYEFAVRDVPGWDPALGTVRPHVHAKVMTADGAVGAVGSANLDITAGYWESELILLVEDRGIIGGLEARLDAILAGSIRFDREDPVWQRLAARRAWWRHWPGMLG